MNSKMPNSTKSSKVRIESLVWLWWYSPTRAEKFSFARISLKLLEENY